MQLPEEEARGSGSSDAAELARRLRAAVERIVSTEAPISLLYSGGLDSSVVARAFPPSTAPQLVVVGTPKSSDLEAARSGAALLGLPLVVHEIDTSDVERTLAHWSGELEGVREPARSVLVASALAVAAAPTPRVLCGQGADELFYGYAHFDGLSSAAAQARSTADLRRLHEVDWPWIQRWAHELGHELESPYLDLDLIAWVRSIPSEMLHGGGVRKPLLRRAARELGVPGELADRPKRAMQYGSGIRRLVGQLDRARRGKSPITAH